MGASIHSSPSGPAGSKQKIKARADTPFPLKQLLILSLARIAEPIAFMSIFPYIYYMIKSFNITTDDAQISVYAGIVTSSFAIAECSCAALWGRLSDRIGRKPVLVIGLSGTGISMLTFGFARSLKVALAARFVGGLLNGNGGVLQTMVAEVVTVKEHQPRAYTFLPLTWGLGSVIGSFLGGTLADPVANYPDLFPNGNAILEKYPFLLPNLCAATMVIFGVTVATLFFHETHPTMKYRRDRGIEFGNWLGRLVTGKLGAGKKKGHKAKRSDATGSVDLSMHDEEAEGLLKNEIEMVDSPSASTPVSKSPSRLKFDSAHASPMNEKNGNNKVFEPIGAKTATPKSVRAAFTPQVVLCILGYGILAFHTIILDQVSPVFFSLPPSEHSTDSLLLFTGGLGLSALQIGWIFSGQAIYSMFFQLLLAPPIIRKLGYLPCFRLTAFTWPLLYLLTPYISLLPAGLPQWAAIVASCLWKTSWGSLAYLTILIMLTNTVKEGGNEEMLGVVNGMSASFASAARAAGPTLAGLLFNKGESMGVGVLVWWLTAGVACVGALESFWMREGSGEPAGVQLAGEEVDEEDEDEDDRTLVDDGGIFSDDEDEEVFLDKETRKQLQGGREDEDVTWIKGEQEGQSEAGAGMPIGLGSTVASVSVAAVAKAVIGSDEEIKLE